MQPVGERAKELLPSVLLTLTSILQALSLEVLWSSASGATHLWGGDAAAIAGWLQIAAVFETVVLIWIFYAHLLMRFRWVPSMRDSIVPFGLGLGQFALAELLQPERLAVWCLLLAALLAYAMACSIAIFRAAERDPDNAWYFAVHQPRARDRYGPAIATVSVQLGIAALAAWTGPGSVGHVVAMALVNVLLFAQIELQRMYWNRSIRLDRQR